MDAAVDHTGVFAEKILALSGSDISILRLKARAYLWAEAVRLPEWFADGGYTTDQALASLFRDLGADYPAGAAPAP